LLPILSHYENLLDINFLFSFLSFSLAAQNLGIPSMICSIVDNSLPTGESISGQSDSDLSFRTILSEDMAIGYEADYITPSS
jgi:hypothetical protein